MFVVAECPACTAEIVHEVNILNTHKDGTINVGNSWEIREFVTHKVNEFIMALPMKINEIEETLNTQGLENLSDKIIDEIKLAGAYESKGNLLPA